MKETRTLVLVLIKVMQTTSVEARRAADDAVHFISLLQQQFSPGGNQCQQRASQEQQML